MEIMCATGDETESKQQQQELPIHSANNLSDGELNVPSQSRRVTFCRRIIAFCIANDFLILVVLAICLAKAYPPLGAKYVEPMITATWIAIMIIFLLAGLALRTDEFVSAFQKLYFNAFVQIFNFGFVSCVLFGFSRLMIEAGAISQVLGDGMAICGSLPITVNMCVVLTKAAGGDEALSIFNTAFSNMIGIFLSPILILGYVGVSGNVPIGTTFYQLSIRVLLPIVVGQVLQKMSRTVAAFVKRFKPYFLRGQEYSLVFILYTTFCKTFAAEQHIKIEQILFMILFQCILLGFVTVVAWFSLRALFRDEPKVRVMGLFGCTQKTIAVGVPLITSIYAKNPNLGLYLLPLLIWYPMQLIIGSLLVPRLRTFIASENERLGIVDKEAEPAESTFSESDEEQPSECAAEGFVGDDQVDECDMQVVDLERGQQPGDEETTISR